MSTEVETKVDEIVDETKNTEGKKEPGMIRLVMVLAIICFVMAFSLGMVNKITAPAIAANTELKIQNSLKQVLPADEYELLEDFQSDNSIVTAVYAALDQGYVVQVAPSGFSGAIDMMAGISFDGTITGIAIINHAETSGLGANATKPEWQAQFIGEQDDVLVTKDGGIIESITGSTITSRAVCVGVNAARAVAASME